MKRSFTYSHFFRLKTNYITFYTMCMSPKGGVCYYGDEQDSIAMKNDQNQSDNVVPNRPGRRSLLRAPSGRNVMMVQPANAIDEKIEYDSEEFDDSASMSLPPFDFEAAPMMHSNEEKQEEPKQPSTEICEAPSHGLLTVNPKKGWTKKIKRTMVGKKKVKKTVHFAPDCGQESEHRHLSSAQGDKKELFWYSKLDLKRIKASRLEDVRMAKSGVPEKEPYCYRGIDAEFQPQQQREQHIQSVKQSVQAVLLEQCRPSSNKVSDKAIAKVYSDLSRPFQSIAHTIGKMDAKAVLDFDTLIAADLGSLMKLKEESLHTMSSHSSSSGGSRRRRHRRRSSSRSNSKNRSSKNNDSFSNSNHLGEVSDHDGRPKGRPGRRRAKDKSSKRWSAFNNSDDDDDDDGFEAHVVTVVIDDKDAVEDHYREINIDHQSTDLIARKKGATTRNKLISLLGRRKDFSHSQLQDSDSDFSFG